MRRIAAAALAAARSAALAAGALLALAAPAAATQVQIDPNHNGVVCNSGCAAPLPFTNIDPNVSLTATSTSSKAPITAGGTVLELTNGGANQVEAVLCPTTTCTASVTSSIIIPAGQTVPVAIGSNTEVAVYAATGSNAITAVSGTGAGYAVGGGLGGGSGGAVTGAASSFVDDWNLTLGATSDGACSTDIATCTEMALLKRENQRLTSILTAIGTPIQATGGTIGLVAGAAYIGKISAVDSGGADATDTGNHAIKVNVVAGGAGGGIATANAGAFALGGATDGWNVTEGAKADSAYAGSGSASLVALLKGLYNNIGSAIPAGSNYIGDAGMRWSSNNSTVLPHVCANRVFKHITSATDTQLVAASGSTTIYVCDYTFSASGALNFYLEKATTGTCATLTQIDLLWTLAANEAKGLTNPFYQGLNAGSATQLCVNTSASGLDIAVTYDQY